jgi:hypothetical protein
MALSSADALTLLNAIEAGSNSALARFLRTQLSTDRADYAAPKVTMAAATSDATAGARTYTAAEILGGVIVRDCAGSSRSDVLPTAALLVAALRSPQVGDVIQCAIVNGSDAAEVITIGAGTGGGFDTNQTATSRVIPQNSTRIVRIRITGVVPAAEAYVVYM